jgi:hypothetical protein
MSFALALVLLPPKKELEDWGGAYPLREFGAGAFQEKTSSSSDVSKTSAKPFDSGYSRFVFDGLSKISFVLSRGKKAEWEVGLPPIDFQKTWDSGAWTGLSMSSRELHHFYVRELRRAPEAKYRVYTLGYEWQTIDLVSCAKREIFMLEKKILKKQNSDYRLTRIQMLSSQELKRENAWVFRTDPGQEILSIKAENCSFLDLDGWPKSFKVRL